MDEARLRFTMNARVSYGDPPQQSLPDSLPLDWVRIPVSFQVTLPAEVMAGARQAGSGSRSDRAAQPSVSIVPGSLRLGTGAHPDGGWTAHGPGGPAGASPDAPSASGFTQSGRHGDRPIGAGALNSLGLDATFGRPATARGVAGNANPAPPAARDARNADRTADAGTDATDGYGRTTGRRALDAVFRAGGIGTLHRAPPPVEAVRHPSLRPADDGSR